MISKEIIYTLILFLFSNVIVWFQLNSQLVWDWAKGTKSMWLMSLMGIPISLLFWWAITIKIGISIMLAITIIMLQLL